MNEVQDLKNVLDKVEKKIIAASKIYGAMNFAFWLAAMLGYYILYPLFNGSIAFTVIYWPVAFGLAIFFSIKISRMIVNIERKSSSKGFGALLGISWSIGAVVGWVVVPSINLGVNSQSSLAMGFLVFITLSIFGMWLTFKMYKIEAMEILPSFLVPAFGIPFSAIMNEEAMAWAGFVVAIGFTLTILWYLYSAFKNIGGFHAEGSREE